MIDLTALTDDEILEWLAKPETAAILDDCEAALAAALEADGTSTPPRRWRRSAPEFNASALTPDEHRKLCEILRTPGLLLVGTLH